MKRDLHDGNTANPNHFGRIEPMPSPAQLRTQLPVSEQAARTVAQARQVIKNMMDRRDPRLLVIVGPCSVHDPKAGLEYARRLRQLADEVSDTLFVVMRSYFEKPRTSVGWKGLINDPGLDNSFLMAQGISLARRFMLDVNELGLPLAVEALDPVSPNYLYELVSWAAIGARTTESQTHRELASGLPMPVGFKNGTDGSVNSALNAMLAAGRAHAFLGICPDGQAAIIRTDGNPYAHLVMRGGANRPNYDTVSVGQAVRAMQQAKLPTNIVIDCAHGNSYKQHELQPQVLHDVVQQIVHGNQSIFGVMIESFLEAGNQSIPKDLAQLRYGCSVTDPCVDWDTTASMLREARALLRPRIQVQANQAGLPH